MKQKEIQPELSSKQIFDNLVKELLAKTESEEEMEIELNGYPADYLDAPNPKKIYMREYRELIDRHGTEIEFDLFFSRGDNFEVGLVFSTRAPMILLDCTMQKFFIRTAKLRQILYDHIESCQFRPYYDGDKMVVKVPTKLLLDNSEAV